MAFRDLVGGIGCFGLSAFIVGAWVDAWPYVSDLPAFAALPIATIAFCVAVFCAILGVGALGCFWDGLSAQGMEASGQDPKGLDAKHDSPVTK